MLFISFISENIYRFFLELSISKNPAATTPISLAPARIKGLQEHKRMFFRQFAYSF